MHYLSLFFISSYLSAITYISAAGFNSSIIVKDPGENIVGPHLELSSTILEEGDTLEYVCRENTETDGNELMKVNTEEGADIPVSTFTGHDSTSRGCNYDIDRQFWCTIVTGQFSWQSIYAGRYYCASHPQQTYLVYGIVPGLVTSGNLDLNVPVGEKMSARVICGATIYPTNVAYRDVFPVTWEHKTSSSEWERVDMLEGFESTSTNLGASYILIINFHPIQNGGDYRCNVVAGNYPMTSQAVSITSPPNIILANDLDGNFSFGGDDTVEFTCKAVSYPFLTGLEVSLVEQEGNVTIIKDDSDGVTKYGLDISSTAVEYHYVRFTVQRVSDLFSNGSSVICEATRNDTKVSKSKLVLVKEKTSRALITVLEENYTVAVAVAGSVLVFVILAVVVICTCKHKKKEKKTEEQK